MQCVTGYCVAVNVVKFCKYNLLDHFVFYTCFTALGYFKLMLLLYVSYLFAGMMPLIIIDGNLLSTVNISAVLWM